MDHMDKMLNRDIGMSRYYGMLIRMLWQVYMNYVTLQTLKNIQQNQQRNNL